MNTIQISDLRKRYGAFVALDGVSFAVPAGGVFGLLGPNGAGKSTTFKCLLGLARADSGDIQYDGAALAPAIFERLAYVPERSVLYEWMTVAEHLEAAQRSYARFDLGRARELLAGFNIDPRKRVRTLSKGMRTGVMVALAFSRDAEVLILDEPTSGLDPVNQRVVLSLIINEAAKGHTVLLSSHQIGQVERAAERIAVIDRGRIILEGEVDTLKADRKIVEGILPSADAPLDGLAHAPNVAHVDRTERIVRVLVTAEPETIATRLTAAGANGVRVIDLNLEDIFLYAVSPQTADADVVAE